MFKFYKDPKSEDKDYVENIFTMLYNLYGKINFQQSRIEIPAQIVGFDELKEYLTKFLFELRLEGITISELGTNEEVPEERFGLPATHEYIQEQGTFKVRITRFGIDNPQITLVEIILFFASLKFNKDGFAVPDEIFDDVEQSYRPFLVLLSIYYGYGILLLERNWISGGYYCDEEMILKRYKYYVPLEINTLIYAFSIGHYYRQFIFHDTSLKTNLSHLNVEIRKEINICEKYFQRNKSDLMNWIIDNGVG